ncbi:putative 3-methyladenine DNA glycosylase [Chrysoperla carnea]|uniref:putative 3-methyladenine DNA glycosylase n=1 Tax=Chrysoperla carnea TaxID=189513 RepID=UPI001D076B3F|nr:putative 3-methyladenine DNA glycosylase [Chrysoperla carnea]
MSSEQLKHKLDNTNTDKLIKMSKTCVRLTKSFYDVSCQELALNLLGKVLVRRLDDNSLFKGRIVETESYLADIDKASHAYNGRRTERNEPMYMPAGTAYVYMTYGMYFCFNISSSESGAAVLLRALEPLTNIEEMILLRYKGKPVPKNFKHHMLCNGPSKLCISMSINKDTCNKLDLSDDRNQALWIEDDFVDTDFKIVKTHRIGIESVGEPWSKAPLRFYIHGNNYVSKRDKKAEQMFHK